MRTSILQDPRPLLLSLEGCALSGSSGAGLGLCLGRVSREQKREFSSRLPPEPDTGGQKMGSSARVFKQCHPHPGSPEVLVTAPKSGGWVWGLQPLGSGVTLLY